MKIIKEALAGTLESSDLLVKVTPLPEDRVDVVIQSEVMHQFGEQIRQVVLATLQQLGLVSGQVVIEDKGALDCAIRARVQTAILRGAAVDQLDWSKLS